MLDDNTKPSKPAVSVPKVGGALPFLGNIIDIGRDTLGFLVKSEREHGEIVSLQLGPRPAMLVTGPDLVEQILVKRHANFPKAQFFWQNVAALFGEGLLTSEGALWQKQRRLAAPAFVGQRLLSYGPAMVQLADRVLDKWQDGQVLDLHPEMMAIAIRIAAKTLFDSEVEEDVNEIGSATNDVIEEVAARFSRPIVIPDAVPLPGHLRYTRAIKRVEKVVQRIVSEHRAGQLDKGDYLSMLLMARDDNGTPMSDIEIRDEAMTALAAGYETTALSLSWSFLILSEHPEIQDRLAAELKEVVGDRPIAHEDLSKLPYLEQVVIESMRLYPPAWAVGREAKDDSEVGGYDIPGGTTILISPWVTHRSERYFEDALAFRPERWAGDFRRTLPRFAYFPFGGGPRICIGNRFALMETMLLIGKIVPRFSMERRPGKPVVPSPSITLRPKGGIWV
jgi:cytochrome P450